MTCRLHEVDAYTYLVDVLQRISMHPANRAIVTPRMWKSLFADDPLRSDLGPYNHDECGPATTAHNARLREARRRPRLSTCRDSSPELMDPVFTTDWMYPVDVVQDTVVITAPST